MKHCLECLIYLLNRNKGVNREIESKNFMLINAGYLNLLEFTVMIFYVLT